MEIIKEAAGAIIAHLREEHFQFSVPALGYDWDVYGYPLPRVGEVQIAFRLEAGQVVLGAFHPRRRSPCEVVRLIELGLGSAFAPEA